MRLIDRTMLVRIALGGALVATLALAGCGRKGPLDAPFAPKSAAPMTLSSAAPLAGTAQLIGAPAA